MKNLFAKYKGVFLALAILVVAAVAMVFYAYTVSGRIYDANAEQLKELYSVASANFYEQSTSSYKHLSTIHSVMEVTDSETKVTSFIEQAKRNWGYTHFYFLDKAGNYQTISGMTGRFDLDEHYRTGIDSGINMAKPGTVPGEGDVLLYISPVSPGSFAGFDYQAIAIGYDRSTFDSTLRIRAYDADARSCVVGSNGRIVLGNGKFAVRNIYSIFDDKKVSFVRGDLDGFKGAVRSGETLTAMGDLDGERCYIVLVPVGYSDWSMLGVVPAKNVNGSMAGIQRMTITVVGGVIAFLVLLVAFWIWRHGRKSVREKEIQLGYQKQLFNVLSNQTDEVFLMFTPDKIQAEYLSPNVERVMGVPFERAKNDLFTFYPELDEAGRRALQERVNTLPLNTPDSAERQWTNPATAQQQWFSVTYLRVGIEGAEKIVTVFSDVTRDIQSRQRLQEALDIAENANRAKSSFLSNMSHDIRTPINAIVGLSALLKRDAEDPERVRQHTRKITASSDHLLGLINDILDMSKIESGKTTLNISEFALREWIDELNTMLRPMANAKEQNFEITAHGIVHETVMGDRLRLNQIMINILSNAVKYTPEGGSITFSIEELEQNSSQMVKFRFRVADTGIGMSEEYKKVIFDPFTREINSRVNKIQGTGLGMAITKQLVDLMGGTISVESEPDKGSVFTVVLVFHTVEQEKDTGFWKGHGIQRVLVVDDDLDTCQGITATMGGYGLDARYATNGEEALRLAQEQHDGGTDFDLFLLDLRMEGLDGMETARLIRERISPTVPIYILTAYDMDLNAQEMADLGISGALSKPFFMANFMMIIQSHDNASTAFESAEDTFSISGLRFLVAEDNELNAEILTELLDSEGVHCVVCPNGEQALSRFLASQPGDYDAILMDVQMPLMNGYEATRAIRNSSHPSAHSIPIIAMTANAFEEDVRDALEAGMNAHLAKPVHMDRLIATVHDLVKRENK